MSFRSVLVLNLCLAIFAVFSLKNQRPDHYKDKIQEGLRLEGFEEYDDVDFERVSKGFLKIHCMSAVCTHSWSSQLSTAVKWEGSVVVGTFIMSSAG